MSAANNGYPALDEALVTLAPNGPELRNTNSNHAPMAIEAMCAMGRGADALPWLEHYQQQLTPRPPRFERIDQANWQAAIGDPRYTSDWFEFFRNELEERPWHEVVDAWAARLAAGTIAAALHGVIRTGHAARAIALEVNAQRKRELADGLAYWAAEYVSLPGKHRSAAHAMPAAAIMRVPTIPIERRGKFTSLTGAVTQLNSFNEFNSVIDAVDPASRDASSFVSDLTATFSRVYLANARDLLTTIAFIHTVTGPAALRWMLPCLGREATETALMHMWHASAALYSTFGTAPSSENIEPPSHTAEELIDRAIATGDEHAIKFTEVCLSESALNPCSEYLAAASHAVAMLSKTRAEISKKM